MTRYVVAVLLVAGLAGPAVASSSPVQPCHGSTYRYGARVYLPGQEPINACIEQ